MKNRIYDESNGLWYERQGDYYIPCLTLPVEKEQPIGLWGCGSPVETSNEVRSTDRAGRRDQRHLRYLKKYHRITYTNLLTSGRLNNYLANIDKQVQEMFLRLVNEMSEKQGVTEKLKAENQMEWARRTNSIRACAREFVDKEIIYA